MRKRVEDGSEKLETYIDDQPIPDLPESSSFQYIWSTTYNWNPESVSETYNMETGYLYQFFADVLIKETLRHS